MTHDKMIDSTCNMVMFNGSDYEKVNCVLLKHTHLSTTANASLIDIYDLFSTDWVCLWIGYLSIQCLSSFTQWIIVCCEYNLSHCMILSVAFIFPTWIYPAFLNDIATWSIPILPKYPMFTWAIILLWDAMGQNWVPQHLDGQYTS